MSAVWDHKKKWKEGSEIQEAIVLSSSYRSNQKKPIYSNSVINCGGETSTSFTYILPEPFIGVTSLKISSIEVPVDVYFTISNYYGNNKFSIDNLIFTIPDGNYTSNEEFVNIINSVIREKYLTLPDVNVLGNKKITTVDGFIYDISYNTPTGCGVFADNNGMFLNFHNANILLADEFNTDASRNILLNFSNLTKDPNFTYTLGWILGYRLSDYNLIAYESTSELVENSLTADSSGTLLFTPKRDSTIYTVTNEVPANFTPTKSFLIAVDDFQHSGIDNIKVGFNSSFLNKRIVARIPFIKTKDINNTFIYNKYNDTPVNIRQYRGPTDITKLKIELLDDLGRTVDLLGSDWNFVLTITRTLDQSIQNI